MIKELDSVVLTCDLPDHGLKAGDVGTVVLVHAADGYEVEFMTPGGDTIAVVSLESGCVRPTAPNEVPHARNVEAA